MKKALVISTVLLMLALVFSEEILNFKSNLSAQEVKKAKDTMNFEIQKDADEWKKILSPEQYYVLREKGTERPFTGKFNVHNKKGTYTCAACGSDLFKSDHKFDSHCGWPSFYDALDKSKIKEVKDLSHGMNRIEVMCAKCGGHLGHVFDDGPKPTGIRYCINSLSLDFIEDSTESK